jgi:hypothetical protein
VALPGSLFAGVGVAKVAVVHVLSTTEAGTGDLHNEATQQNAWFKVTVALPGSLVAGVGIAHYVAIVHVFHTAEAGAGGLYNEVIQH